GDAGLAELPGERLGRLDRDFGRGAVAQHPGGPAGGHRADGEWHDLLTPERAHPADRSGVRELWIAPAHVLGRTQAGHGGGPRLGQRGQYIPSGLLVAYRDVGDAVDLDPVERVGFNALRTGEALGGFGRRTVGRERRRESGTAGDPFMIRL